MPSLETRRRRAGGPAAVSASDMMEGGGSSSRGEVRPDSSAQTRAKIDAFRAQTGQTGSLSARAHLVTFPLFLFGLLALFSHALHLSFLACVLLPSALGLGLLLLTVGMERVWGARAGADAFAQHGVPLISVLLIFTMVGLAVSQLFFRDKFGKPLL